jgi:hypothetical protein
MTSDAELARLRQRAAVSGRRAALALRATRGFVVAAVVVFVGLLVATMFHLL